MLTNTPNPVKMTPTEYRLLTTLINHKGQVLSSDQLVKLVWESSDTESKDRVKYAILRLRKKLDTGISADNPIETVRGFGYRYRELA